MAIKSTKIPRGKTGSIEAASKTGGVKPKNPKFHMGGTITTGNGFNIGGKKQSAKGGKMRTMKKGGMVKGKC